MWKTAAPDRYNLLKAYAIENRNHPTEAEKIFWELVRAKRTGYKFTRQQIIGDYIIDFFCPQYNIAVEIDGGYHAERQQQEDDETRTQWLETIGCHVIRFSNESVLFDICRVKEDLIAFIKSISYT